MILLFSLNNKAFLKYYCTDLSKEIASLGLYLTNKPLENFGGVGWEDAFYHHPNSGYWDFFP